MEENDSHSCASVGAFHVTGGLRFSLLQLLGSCCSKCPVVLPWVSLTFLSRAETNNTCLSVLGLEQSCNKCATSFKDNDTKHHCRACGEGFCDSCSSKTRPVPERGWGPAPVRVCDNCYEARNVQLGNVGPRGCKGGGDPLFGTGYWEVDPHMPNPVLFFRNVYF